MTGTPPVSPELRSQLEAHASKHAHFSTFQQDMLRLAEHIWHNLRTRGDQPTNGQLELTPETETDEASDAPAEEETPEEPAQTEAPASSPADARVTRAQRLAQTQQTAQ